MANAFDPSSSVHDGDLVESLTALMLVVVVVGLAPAAGVLIHERSLARKSRLGPPGRFPPSPLPPPRLVNRSPPPAIVYAPQLPSRLQPHWNRLSQAWGVITELQRQGWVDADSTRGVPQSMARLHQLGVADGMTDNLGGRRSSAVEQQLNRLADLLVALADEAVDHQAMISATDFTPATLTAAAQRLAADSAAYRELMELGGVWAAE
ncbi:hypothetical protein ACFWUP_05435 [Nocardia sp. NPDC058658]|uniref:hypothetical protein n=1 Tax=Nocardia sp. NPDC058658 TaxID=3346580 RepID=UPI00365B599D